MEKKRRMEKWHGNEEHVEMVQKQEDRQRGVIPGRLDRKTVIQDKEWHTRSEWKKQVNKSEQKCEMCGDEKETVDHFIIECDKYKEQRQELDRKVARLIGREEWEERKEGEHKGIRTVLGLTGDKISESIIVNHMKTFLVECWTIRNQHSRR